MSRDNSISVIGCGMWTAAGHDASSTVAALQAGVAGSREANLWDRTAGEMLNAFQVSAQQWWEGESFLPELAYEAILQCYDQLGDVDPQTVPLSIAVSPSSRAGRSADLEQILLSGLKERLGFELPNGSGVLAGGRCGVASLLRNAQARSAENPVQILLGVESFLRQNMVEHYIDENRLLCGGNSSGFIPGEAAGALILASSEGHQGPALRIAGIGEGNEPSIPGQGPGGHPAGSGLTTAMAEALRTARRDFFETSVILSDLNGEHSKFKEASVANVRLDRLPPEGKSRRIENTVEQWAVAEIIGEVGAAVLPIALGYAFEAGRLGFLPSPVALFHAGEDDGQRIAIVGEFSA